MDEERKQQVLTEVLTTLLILAFYWISTQPEWKLEYYLTKVIDYLKPVKRRALSWEHKEILRKFRQEISDWEHGQCQ